MDHLIKVGEVAERLVITKMGVYGMVFKNKIPAVKISRRCLRFRNSDIEEWLDKKSQKGNGRKNNK